MKHYQGHRTRKGAEVTVNGKPLNPRHDLRNHSPTGLEWGYGGSGSAQTALAILADHLGDDEDALNLYQRFKWDVIANLPHEKWVLTGGDINQALQRIRAQEAKAACHKS